MSDEAAVRTVPGALGPLPEAWGLEGPSIDLFRRGMIRTMKIRRARSEQLSRTCRSTLLAVVIVASAPGLGSYQAAAQVLNGAVGSSRGFDVRVGLPAAPAGGGAAIAGPTSVSALGARLDFVALPSAPQRDGASGLAGLPGAATPSAGLALDRRPLLAAPARADAAPTARPAAPASPAVVPSAVGGPRSFSAASGGEKPEAPRALEAAKALVGDSGESGDPSADASRAFDGAERVAFRLRMRQPGVYLLEKDGTSKDDSVGRKLTASLQTADIGAALKTHALENLRGKTLYVTGVEMGSEQDALRRVREAVSGTPGGLDQVEIRILSVPRPRSRGGLLRSLRDRLVYFMPSMRRDYQRPLRDEVISGALSTLILELPNALYLLLALSPINAAIVLAVHAAVLASYTIWQRSLGNWLLRSSGAEMFLKQLLTSLPFVINYNVFGHFTGLASFFHAHGIAGALRQFPAQLLQFSVTQGLTTLLQTVFYSWVVTRGFRAWASNQKLPQNAEAARSWVNWLLMPWLWIDAIFLTQAATAANVLFRWHSFALTSGHLSLAALTLLGSIVVFYPSLLDKTLPAYKRIRAWVGKLKIRKG